MVNRSLTEQAYRKDLNTLVCVTPVSACSALLEQAKSDKGTRDLIIHSMLPSVFQYAMHAYVQCTHIDPMELVGVGNATLIERWDAAQSKENPIRYLFNEARMGILGFVRQYGFGPITFPNRGDEERPQYTFFDILGDVDALDSLEDPTLCAEETSVDPRPLYEALDSLSTETARELVTQVFGLYGREAMTLVDLAGGDWKSKAYAAKRGMLHQKIRKMRAYLIENYPEFVERYSCADPKEKQRARAYIRLYEIGKISQSTRRKLDAARKAIEERGETLTGKALRKEAGVGSSTLSAYMYELRLKNE